MLSTKRFLYNVIKENIIPEDEEGSIRIDKLVASLEMEYINKAVKGYIDCPINARMLYEKYFVE